MNEVARVKDEGNKQKMTVSILDEEASKQKLPLDN